VKLKDWKLVVEFLRALFEFVLELVKLFLIWFAIGMMFLCLFWIEYEIQFGGRESNPIKRNIEFWFGVLIFISYIYVAKRLLFDVA